METINHECYVSLEVAKLLKQAGFDWKCINRYIKDTGVLVPCLGEANWNDVEWGINDYKSAPSLAVAQGWLREVKDCDIYVTPTNGLYFVHIRKYLEPVETKCEYSEYPNKFVCHTYEEALEAGIKKCLTILLEEKK